MDPTESAAIEAFTDAFLKLHEAACSNAGIDDDVVNLAATRLAALRPYYADRDALPKALVNIFIDMHSALMSAADRQGAAMVGGSIQ